jgi:hypothetical protein
MCVIELDDTMPTNRQRLERELQDRAHQGYERGQRAVLLRLLARRFVTVPEAIAARVDRAGTDEIERWAERLLEASSLDDVFAAADPPPVRGPEEPMTWYYRWAEPAVLQELVARIVQEAIEKVQKTPLDRGRRALLVRLLTRRFGSLPEAVSARIRDAKNHELACWLDRALDASSLGHVLAAG